LASSPLLKPKLERKVEKVPAYDTTGKTATARKKSAASLLELSFFMGIRLL